ncbi:MAG: FtsW/RodA/SpoVE family cell cycle protein [Eubacterium sp.]|nr:FtsW/RodA/SpoVE family cell cycle protein [Eubacterium sp.]
MSSLICTISKYLILIFMAIFTARCFLYFTAKTHEKRKHIANFQVVDIFAIHFLCHLTMYLNTREPQVIWYYLVELVISILYMVLFRIFYPEASRLIINIITLLMLTGYSMLTRLDRDMAVKQFILASIALFLTSLIPYVMGKLKTMKNWTVLYGIAGILFLLTVFIPGLGQNIYGAQNWNFIGGISIQPMELVKISFVLFVASGLVKAKTLKDIIINAVISVIFMGVLAVEKDFGAITIFYITYITMVYLATSRPIFLFGGIALAVGAVILGYFIFKDTLFAHIIIRVEAWKDPWAYQDTGGYQLSESLFSIGTGGFTGVGLGNGRPYLIPVVTSDFIFSAICEELGSIFGLCLILVYISGFIAMANVATKCNQPFYKYMTFGFAISFITQVMLNIGGVTRFIPSTGVTLPLISYGLSSIFCTLIMFSMVQYIYVLVSREGEQQNEEERALRAAARAAAALQQRSDSAFSPGYSEYGETPYQEGQ